MVDIIRDIIPIIASKASYFREVREGVYVTRCCFCGDTQKNMKMGHLYLLVNDNRCRCYCHKCEANVPLDEVVLENLIGKHDFVLNKTTIRRINPGNPNVIVETDVPNKDSQSYRYLENRFGCDFTADELYKFRIIDDQETWLQKYNINSLYPIKNSICFVTADGNTLCYRNVIENDTWRWIKKKIYPKYDSSPYTMRGAVDILSTDDINIVMAEGIMDIIGVYKHITQTADLYMATMGKDYTICIKWLINKGIFGKNISITIFSDDDVDIKYLRKMLRWYRWMFGNVSVVYNDADHDFGIPKDRIILRDPILI